nr:PREDICTED: short transient receptor potential channel 3-like [Megachile rotundata]
MRLFAYKAITNPAYICQTVDDPILQAFNLAHELKQAASFDREFYHEYKRLSENVAQFATDLIACARSVEEVEVILQQSTGFAHSSKFLYPRLLFALSIKQRTFVAHPNVQQVWILWFFLELGRFRKFQNLRFWRFGIIELMGYQVFGFKN